MVAMAKRQLATIPLIFGVALSNLVFTFGKLECEDLPVEDCAFSVASSGTRCVLEKYKGKDDSIQYECQSSIIMAEKQEEWIESDECVKACGLERMSVGLSTDLLMDSHFTEMLCSSECLNNCPNLIDLYISLAAGEGMYLPQLCKTHRMSSRRVIADPVKKAIDAEYQKSLLPRLRSGGSMARRAWQTPESGAGTGACTPPADGLQRPGPDYRGYVGTSGEITPTSPVSWSFTPPVPGSTTPLEKAPAAQTSAAGEPSINKRPFFFGSSPPTTFTTIQSTPVEATPETGATPPETAPYISASAPGMAPSPSPEQGSKDLYWQQLSAEKVMPDRSQLNDEEYLYETYFH